MAGCDSCVCSQQHTQVTSAVMILPLTFYHHLLLVVTSQGTGVDPDPAMDNCDGAAGPRPINEVFSPGNTATQTVDAVTDGFCGVEISTPGIWWWVNGTGEVLRASSCEERTEIKTKISVFTGTCDALRCVKGDVTPDFECPVVKRKDTGEWDTLATAIDFATVAGQHYYILVQEMDTPGTVWMNFARPSYPPNNDCVDARGPVPRDNTMIVGTTSKADISQVAEGYCGAPSLYPGVWYQFLGTGKEVTIGACGEFNFDGIYISVYHGATCDDKKCVEGSYETNVRDEGKCSFGAANALRPLTSYTVSTVDRDRYYVYIHWARTSGDQPTGDFRLYIDDGEGGKGGTGALTAIKFAPPGATSDGSGDGGSGSNNGGSGSDSDKDKEKNKSGANPNRHHHSWISLVCGALSVALLFHL